MSASWDYVSWWCRAEDAREKIDIVKLNAEIEEIVMREDELREAIHNIITEIEGENRPVDDCSAPTGMEMEK